MLKLYQRLILQRFLIFNYTWKAVEMNDLITPEKGIGDHENVLDTGIPMIIISLFVPTAGIQRLEGGLCRTMVASHHGRRFLPFPASDFFFSFHPPIELTIFLASHHVPPPRGMFLNILG